MKKVIWMTVLLLIVAGAGALTWMANSGWVDEFNAEQNQLLQQRIADGQAFARTANQQQCLDQALQDFDGCLAYSCTVASGKFLKACLDSATPSTHFCEGVPEFREKPTEDDKAWAKDYCLNNNIRGDNCRLLMRQQQLFCSQTAEN